MTDVQSFIQWLVGVLVLAGGLYALLRKTKSEEKTTGVLISRSAIADLEVLNKRQAADLEEYRRDVARLERRILDFERNQTKEYDRYESRISVLEKENKDLRELVTELNEKITVLNERLVVAHSEKS